MANGSNLNVSVIFSAVTQAFNAGVKGAAQNYQQATSAINSSSEDMGRVTQALAGKLIVALGSLSGDDAAWLKDGLNETDLAAFEALLGEL